MSGAAGGGQSGFSSVMGGGAQSSLGGLASVTGGLAQVTIEEYKRRGYCSRVGGNMRG
jgi:hypothetical protein